MDESAIQDRLRRIEQRQYLVLLLLVVPYLVGIALVVGVWVALACYAVTAVVAFGISTVSRRRKRNAAGQ